jgi:dihydrofolate synthase/folylpolyglutamate synthase
MQAPRAFLSSLEQIGIKLGLDQIRGLVAALDHPEYAYRSIVIAGTNGKGSVTAMLERGLRASGYRTGRYTSPHLVHLEERFTIDGVDVAPHALDAALARVQHASTTLPAPPSFFEATTAAALDLFRSAAVDVALLEVGLGGRLDATNVVDALASVITSIDFDHQQFLGDSIEAIAGEKAGVIKAGTFCVLAANRPTVQGVVARRCREVGAELVDVTADLTVSVVMDEGRARIDLGTPVRRYEQVTLSLRGRHQVQNAVTAMRALEELDRRGLFRVPAAAWSW